MILPRTLGLFLLGIVAWRSQILRNADRRSALLAALAVIGIAGGFVLTLAARNPAALSALLVGRLTPLMASAATVAFAVGYSCLVLALANVSGLRGFFAFIAPMGPMALTNYICQSIVLGLIFIQLRLWPLRKNRDGGGTGPRASDLCAADICQPVVVRRHRLGPLEWLWRTLMYGRHLPRSGM
jgi:uncharacterized protein